MTLDITSSSPLLELIPTFPLKYREIFILIYHHICAQVFESIQALAKFEVLALLQLKRWEAANTYASGSRRRST